MRICMSAITHRKEAELHITVRKIVCRGSGWEMKQPELVEIKRTKNLYGESLYYPEWKCSPRFIYWYQGQRKK